MHFNLSDQNSIANQFIHDLRDSDAQRDRARFRNNLERLGEIMAYEISKKLSYNQKSVHTPLGVAPLEILQQMPVLITILRAGLPYFQGFLNFFDRADCGFVGEYRKEGTNEVEITLDYLATPALEGRDVIIIDPMLATGKSFMKALQAALKHGKPRNIFIAALIAAPEGIRYIEQNCQMPYSLWTCAIDEKLNLQYYIVPGLGDAGDLSYGSKM